jgi:DNA-binding transcriptional regulator YhcF (GntR family)
MAENSAISPVTVRKAFDRYEKHGIIQRIPRKGTFVKLGNEPRSPVSPEPASKSEWIVSKLKADTCGTPLAGDRDCTW